MIRKLFTGLLTATLLLVASCAQDKIKIEKLDDLPRYTYKIDIKATDLLKDESALGKLASEVKTNLISDLEKYEIADKTTIKDYYANLGTIALVENDYDGYLAALETRIELEEKEALKLTTGLFARAFIAAKKSGEDNFEENFKTEFSNLVNQLPYGIVESDIKSLKGSAEILSENLLLGVAEERFQPVMDQSDGEMSKEIASRLLGMSNTINNFIPLKQIIIEVISAYLDVNHVEKIDIWAERNVDLEKNKGYTPVVIAIWDSGTDVEVFTDKLWINKNEIPGNGIDDDNNGYIDDVNGIAYTLHSDKSPDLLFQLGDLGIERSVLQRMMKGLEDISANIESDEATELKKQLSQMDQSEVRPFIESIAIYGNHAHGTHVAGIAAEGNPFAKILISRFTANHKMIPEEPTLEQARKDSVAAVEVVKYFRDNGVRVVNMSWGGSLAGIESALEANNAGGTPEERKALAREIFEIDKSALFVAFKEASEILFVTSSGNSDNDVSFEEFIPSSFDLPNIISVGAVDQSGDETSFTSFGKVDVYANGFEVESFVPGGDRLKMSGTSMSSPNVTNLAAKLFAINPNLTPVEARALIEKGCDDNTAGDRVIKLINPMKTIEILLSGE